MEINPADIRAMVRVVTKRAPGIDEDLEQEAALRAFEAVHKGTEVRHPRAFLMKIVHDTVVDHWRRRRLLENIADVDETRFAQPCRAEDDLDRRRLSDALRLALDELDSGKRATIDLYYREDFSIAEIAARQSKSASAVKMELLRARRVLSRKVVSLMKKKSR